MTSTDGDDMSPSAIDITLSGIRLPGDGPLRRKMPRAKNRRTQDYIDRFDAHTLVYDCFYDPDTRAVTLVCPRLLNLWHDMRRGFSIAGHPVTPRRQTRIRTDYLRIASAEKPEFLTLKLGDWQVDVPVGDACSQVFAGLNCMTAVSKNNRPEWIADWARYHVSAHGLQAVVVFDNGSTEFHTDLVRQALAAVPGLKAFSVIEADFPYGPSGAGGWQWETSSRFFQTAMLNIARLRLFASARSVLNVDIDELVVSRSARSVFDASVRSKLGLTAFRGKWAYVKDADTPQRHNKHVWSKRSGGENGNTKWCIASAGRLGRASWQVHRLAELVFRFAMDPDFFFHHCRNTTTNWKVERLAKKQRLEPDPNLEELFATHLPD